MTQYLDFAKLEAIDPVAFRSTQPFPYANPYGLLTDEGYQQLLANMPDISLFEKIFGYRRLGGQEPHNRYALEWTPEVKVPEPWEHFIAELRSDRYRKAVARLMGGKKVEFRFHWHYTPNGCSVSPHTDSKREHGSHLFYFNAEGEWDPDWGGETLVLDDGGKLDFRTATPKRHLHVPGSSGILHDPGDSVGIIAGALEIFSQHVHHQAVQLSGSQGCRGRHSFDLRPNLEIRDPLQESSRSQG